MCSVVNADCRTHDVANLYVVDGSVFPSSSEKNPTHTIMALAARTAVHIADHVGFMYLGELVEYGPAEQVFGSPREQRTREYVEGAFG